MWLWLRRQVANFYNTMGSQIIPSQKAMLLETLLEFETAVQKPTVGSRADGTVTWSNPDQCQAFVKRLQVCVRACGGWVRTGGCGQSTEMRQRGVSGVPVAVWAGVRGEAGYGEPRAAQATPAPGGGAVLLPAA